VGSQSTSWWGMVMLIVTEATLFGALISAYFYLRFNAPAWPLGGIERPELILPGIGTVILLSSSIPMYLAERGIRAGKVGRLRLGLAISLVLGAIFLGIQAAEYLRSDFRPWTNAYGSLFYTITAFHGLHVLGALLLNAGVQVLAWRGHFNARQHAGVQNVALYWHFVDAVWIVIFASLYLSPYVS
jgi:heme/copper-type cytochrome/quinol oxidase subunit 3